MFDDRGRYIPAWANTSPPRPVYCNVLLAASCWEFREEVNLFYSCNKLGVFHVPVLDETERITLTYFACPDHQDLVAQYTAWLGKRAVERGTRRLKIAAKVAEKAAKKQRATATQVA
jgi:hypothetical protein